MRKLFLFVSVIFLLGNGEDLYPYQLVIISQNGDEYKFDIDIANTMQKRKKGLMYRSSIPSDAGMLFLSDKSQKWSMWMKNTFVPLDMLFFDENNKIIYIKENVEEKSLDIVSCPYPAKGVIELNGGSIKRLGIKAGDRIEY